MTLEWALEVYFNLYLNFCKNIQVMRLLGRTMCKNITDFAADQLTKILS